MRVIGIANERPNRGKGETRPKIEERRGAKMRHGKIARATRHVAILAAICFVAGVGSARAQNSSEGRGPNAAGDGDTKSAAKPNTAATSSTPASNAEILKELETMRARIAELEALLKAQSGGTLGVNSA